MTGPFSLILVLLAGACLMPSLVHLRLWTQSRDDRTQLWYALLGCSAAAYIVCTVLLYDSPDVEWYRMVLRWQTWSTPLFLIALFGVARGLSGAPSLGIGERLLTCALVVEPFARLVDPWTFVYRDVVGLGHRQLAWHESIAVLRAGSHPYGSLILSLLFLVGIAVLVQKAHCAWKAGRTTSAGLLLVSSVTMLAAAVADTIIVVYVLPVPFVSEPAMAGIVLLLGWKMQADVFQAGLLRREMEAGRSVLATLVEHASDLVVRMDAGGRWTWASPSIRTFAGLEPDQATGRCWTDFVPAGYRNQLDGVLRRIRDGEDEVRESYRMHRADGNAGWVETIARAHRDGAGGLLEIHCVTRDIEEARGREERLGRLESELRESNANLERRVQDRTEALRRTVKDLEAFAATASHDLRAPLRAMEGYAKALDEDHGALLPAEGQAWLERIRASASRLGDLIESLLRLARTGQEFVARQETDVTALARGILAEFQGRDPEREASIRVEEGLYALCDPALARTVFENLLGNAWKYSSRSPRTVVELSRNAGGWFEIRDEGAGFDMKWADRLFQSFQRLHRSEDFEGSGIGLASVRRILELHGGQIQAQAETGKGATFRFHFGDVEGY